MNNGLGVKMLNGGNLQEYPVPRLAIYRRELKLKKLPKFLL